MPIGSSGGIFANRLTFSIYVAESLKDYLRRHPQIEQRCKKNGEAKYLTTENPEKFKEQAQIFLHEPVEVDNITLG